MNPPPPPPPPHGEKPFRGGLPDGNYDIFIIPPHSAGNGFLYLPSLKPARNSFLAGVFCTLLTMGIWTVVYPVLKDWFATIVASGGMGVVVLLVGVGVAGWAWGKTQGETGGPGEGGGGGPSGTYANGSATSGGGGPSNTYPGASGGPPPSTPGGMPGTPHGPPPHHSPPPNHGPPPGADPRPPPKPTWQRTNTGHTNTSGTAGGGTAKSGWERAREETRKKEEDRRKAEELRKKREDEENARVEQREREAREREARERRETEQKERREKDERERREKEERERRELEAKERREKEAKERREKEAKERREKELKERREREAKERREREEREKREKGEKEEDGEPSSPSPKKATFPRPVSPTKKPPQPSVKTAAEDDAFSFRPYDKQKRPVHKADSTSSIYSETSYAPSQSTARTTPPPSTRGPYHTKDPDKIVIKAVYSFNNAFMKLPIAQLISGVGSVTDGLILRITTEGLFIDDDVRGVPQREWDVKAWTMKLVEVWCPQLQDLGANSGSAAASRPAAAAGRSTFFGPKVSKVPTSEETDAFLDKVLLNCKTRCVGRTSPSISSRESRSNASASQSGEHKGLHVLRASIRDQEGKRYVFVLQEEEGWKVAIGLQRLRRGTQVRALGVSGMAVNESKAILENMGWT